MKTLFGPCQAVPTHPESVRRSLNRFAIAAILAGASWLALASPAEAKIVYVTDNVTITGDGVITLLKNGPVEFTIQAAYSSGSCGILGLGVYHDASVSATATTGSGVEAGALSNGDPIGPTQSFNKGESLMASETLGTAGCNNISYGYWCNGTATFQKGNQKPCFTVDGYLGLEFELEVSTYYGWAHIVVAPDHKALAEFTVQLTGYAYETVPGMSINAGQTADADDSSAAHPGPLNRDDSGLGAVPTDPAHAVSLDTFALGAQNAPLLRRKESAGALPENR
jgi:hypothetical protein